MIIHTAYGYVHEYATEHIRIFKNSFTIGIETLPSDLYYKILSSFTAFPDECFSNFEKFMRKKYDFNIYLYPYTLPGPTHNSMHVVHYFGSDFCSIRETQAKTSA